MFNLLFFSPHFAIDHNDKQLLLHTRNKK